MTAIKSEPENLTVAQQVFYKVECETTVLFFTIAEGLTEVVPHRSIAKKYACMASNCITYVYRGRSFHITLAHFAMGDVYPTKDQNVGKVVNARERIVHVKEVYYLYPSTAKAVKSYKPVSYVLYTPAPHLFNHMTDQESVKGRGEEIIRTSYLEAIQILAKFQQ